MKKRNVFFPGLLVVLLAIGLVLAGCGDNGDPNNTGGNNSGGNNSGGNDNNGGTDSGGNNSGGGGTEIITLNANGQWGWQAVYESDSLFSGNKITQGNEYTFTYSFTSNVAMDYLQVVLVDNGAQGNGGYRWVELSGYKKVKENIVANTAVSGTVTITATGTATDTTASANRLVFQAGTGTASKPTLTFTTLSLGNGNSGGNNNSGGNDNSGNNNSGGNDNNGGNNNSGGNDNSGNNNSGGNDNNGGNNNSGGNDNGGNNNSGGNSNGGNNSGGGGTAIPSAPTGVTATAQSSSSISISWSAVSGATSYKVYYEIGSSTTKSLAGTVTGTSYTHTGLQASTTYYYYITAVNSAGESGYSSYKSATTQSSSSGGGGTTVEYRLDQPTFGTCSKSGNNLTINWSLTTSGKTPNGLYTYTSPSNIIIQVYNGTSFDNIQTLSASARTYTLNNYATYQYSPAGVSGNRVTIRVYCTSGSSAYDSRYSTNTYFVESNYWSPSY